MSYPKAPYLNLTPFEISRKFNRINAIEKGRVDDAWDDPTAPFTFNAALEEFPQKRNRYSNVLPWDHSRVVLDVSKGHSDYINASWVTLSLGLTPQTYIATQGPLPSTVGHFWQMVWASGQATEAVAVVMLTPLEEKGVTKCHRYWPAKNESFELQDPAFPTPIRVECLSTTQAEPGIFHSVLLVNNQKTVHHLYYNQWEDFGTPTAAGSLVTLSNMVAALCPQSAPVVHCSAGVGRTGTFIAVDYLLRHTPEFSGALVVADMDTIEAIVVEMRSQRMMLVQSAAQYPFIYEVARMVYATRGTVE